MRPTDHFLTTRRSTLRANDSFVQTRQEPRPERPVREAGGLSGSRPRGQRRVAGEAVAARPGAPRALPHLTAPGPPSRRRESMSRLLSRRERRGVAAPCASFSPVRETLRDARSPSRTAGSSAHGGSGGLRWALPRRSWGRLVPGLPGPGAVCFAVGQDCGPGLLLALAGRRVTLRPPFSPAARPQHQGQLPTPPCGAGP